MNRQERKHGQPKKQWTWLWIILLLVLAVAAYFYYQETKGTGVDYTQYQYPDTLYAAPNATILIEEFSDFECPYCQQLAPTIRAVRDAYKTKVRIVFKEFPLSIHPESELAAEAAECSREQGRFWAYHDVLFESKLLDSRSLKLHAKGLGLNMNQWQECLDSGKTKLVISQDLYEGDQRGVTGTPSIFINGEKFSGRTVADFEAVIAKQ